MNKGRPETQTIKCTHFSKFFGRVNFSDFGIISITFKAPELLDQSVGQLFSWSLLFRDLFLCLRPVQTKLVTGCPPKLFLLCF